MSLEPISREAGPIPHKRRKRYSGKHPHRFEDKYKEHGKDAETIQKVIASGKTPAGTHRPIMVAEILAALAPQPGEIAVDCTLGYGGHAQEILKLIQPGGKLLGLDQDPIELPKTELRLREFGFDADAFQVYRTNFAGLTQVLAKQQLSGADLILADLGVSSMQIDDPSRGFSVKLDGPLDMRMNPQRGQPVSVFLQKAKPLELAEILRDYSDEPYAATLAPLLAGKSLATTQELANAIRLALPRLSRDDIDQTIRRVFQALRIAVNDEYSALDTLLRQLPACLNPNGRAALLTFHSGEDRRVKKAFASGLATGSYTKISENVIRPTPQEMRSNPRSSPAKLRWARRG